MDFTDVLDTFVVDGSSDMDPVELLLIPQDTDKNFESSRDWDNADTYQILSAPMETEVSNEYKDGGVVASGDRIFYTHWPIQLLSGNPLLDSQGNPVDIETEKEVEEPANRIRYDDTLYDVEGKVEEYKRAGFMGIVGSKV